MDSGTELKIDVAALTDVGCVRTNNEDGFGYDLASRIFVVCDGMGGMAAGEVASATAVKELVENFSQDASGEATTEDRLYRAILSANQQVFELAQTSDELRGMGTTLVAACIDGRRLLIGNVGDSRAYFLRGGVCAQITNDHSFLAEQVRKGAMNLEEAKASPLQSVITRAIGTTETVEPDIFTGDLEAGDIVLLTSDGLTRYADAKAIAMLIFSCTNLADACQALIDRAKQYGAVDNVTCLLLQFLPTEAQRAEGAPVHVISTAAAPVETHPAAEPAVEAPSEAAAAGNHPTGETQDESTPDGSTPAAAAMEAVEKAFAEMLAEEEKTSAERETQQEE
jgi:serine/threonine protein phosphatase PrpC